MDLDLDILPCDLSEPILIPQNGAIEKADEGVHQLCFANDAIQS